MTVRPDFEPPGPESVLDSLDHLLDRIARSTEPAAVLTSLAGLCVPEFSDHCSVEIVEGDGPAYLVDSSGSSPDTTAILRPQSCRGSISIPIVGAAHGATGYRATLACGWLHRDATPLDAVIARILAGRAVALIAEERLQEQAQRANDTVANLRIALVSSRVIGNAVGILMVAYKITDEAAFERLRELSQRSNRRVLDIATDVVMTGTLARD